MSDDLVKLRIYQLPPPGTVLDAYLDQVFRCVKAKGIDSGIHYVFVEHQAHCPLLNGGAACACMCEITICGGSA